MVLMNMVSLFESERIEANRIGCAVQITYDGRLTEGGDRGERRSRL
jgi:hypothetical protein